jgi:hypothetical protein
MQQVTDIVGEYLADVRGREERNVDVWIFDDSAIRRAGIIRQGETTIWFEAEMKTA